MKCSSFFGIAAMVAIETFTVQAQLPPFKIVHLGDSFSSGNGARTPTGDLNYAGVESCYRSPTNWGSIFAESLSDVFSVTYINRACSGASLKDLFGTQELGDEPKTSAGECPTPTFPSEEFYNATSPTSCTRFLVPQVDALDLSTNLVLMTFGANDFEFGNVIKECLANGFRSPRGCESAINSALTSLTAIESELTASLIGMSNKLNLEAKVVLVAYPYFVLDVMYQLSGGGFVFDAANELRDLATQVEMTQQAAVNAANVAAGREFSVLESSTKALFEGREPHPSIFANNPGRWINKFEGSAAEWFLFNADGHMELGTALSVFETFGAVPGSFDGAANIDMAFVVDTTGSMSDEIGQVRTDLTDLITQLSSATTDYRVAVVSYQDFPSRCDGGYEARVDQDFTNSLPLIQTAIDGLFANGGCDFEETVFSGIHTALNLVWRPGVTKIMIVIGDAPALVDDATGAEPISGLTAASLIAESIALDPVAVVAADLGSLESDGSLMEIASGTGGSVETSTDIVETISTTINTTAAKPFAWLGTAYSGRIGWPILFDGSGSFDPSGNEITLYEWDFDGDGVFDMTTLDPFVSNAYDVAFDGFVVLRVTSAGGTGLASAHILVNDEGSTPQGEDETCEVDGDGISIIIGDDGSFLPCGADSLPEEDKEDVSEGSGPGDEVEQKFMFGCSEEYLCKDGSIFQTYAMYFDNSFSCTERCILFPNVRKLFGWRCGTCGAY